jgi:hypothetical protein
MWNAQGFIQKERKAKEQLEEKHVNKADKRSWRPIARNRRKWKEFVDNLCSCWNDGLYLLLLFRVTGFPSFLVLLLLSQW